MKKFIQIGLLFIIAFVLVYFLFNDNAEVNKKLFISEIVSNNVDVLKDNYNYYSDYIELYNNTNKDIDLSGYYLSDDIYNPKKFMIDGIVIKAKSYLIIYASGRNYCDSENNICHTNFKISSKGENILFTTDNLNVLTKVVVPELKGNESYSLIGNSFKKTNATPLEENRDDVIDTSSKNYKVYINEYMTHNENAVYDEYGYYYDFVELYNDSNKEITLKNYYLSDDENDLYRYKIPETKINAHGYLVIYLAGENKDGLYANFKLSDTDKYLILSNTNKVIDKVEIKKLDTNVSMGLSDKKWMYFATPTPGYANTTGSLETWGE